MGKVEGFEDLEIWKKGMQLSVSIYQVFGDCKDYGFKDQIQRASVSIPSNIAEGFERNTDKEFVHFLFVARGSCAELRTQLYLAIKLGYIAVEKGTELVDMTKELSKGIYSLIRYRQKAKGGFHYLSPFALHPLP